MVEYVFNHRAPILQLYIYRRSLEIARKYFSIVALGDQDFISSQAARSKFISSLPDESKELILLPRIFIVFARIKECTWKIMV